MVLHLLDTDNLALLKGDTLQTDYDIVHLVSFTIF